MNKNFKSIIRIMAYQSTKLLNKLLFKLASKSQTNKLIIFKNSILLRPSFKIKGKNNNLTFAQSGTFRNLKIQINGNNNYIHFDKYTKVYEELNILVEGDNCKIYLGENTTIGSAKIQLGESETQLLIGKDCMLSRNIKINTSDFHSILDLNTGNRINKPRSVSIEAHVWIGNSVLINKGAIIRSNSIVAANSTCVGKEYSSNSIIGGLPAKVIRENVNWLREKI